jgi:hypothetical protein
MTKKTLKQIGRVKSIEIQINYDEFYQYLKSQKLDTLVEWLDDFDNMEKLLEYIVSIHSSLKDYQKINAYLGLSASMRLEGFQIQSTEIFSIDLDFRGDEEYVEFEHLGVIQ